MSQDLPPEDRKKPNGLGIAAEGEAWTVLSYLIAGLVFWAGLGWLLDKWLGTHFIVLIGMLVGMGAAFWSIWIRYGRAPSE